MDLVEFLEITSPRPFALWADPTTHIMEVVLDGDRPVNPAHQRLRAVNERHRSSRREAARLSPAFPGRGDFANVMRRPVAFITRLELSMNT